VDGFTSDIILQFLLRCENGIRPGIRIITTRMRTQDAWTTMRFKYGSSTGSPLQGNAQAYRFGNKYLLPSDILDCLKVLAIAMCLVFMHILDRLRMVA
jgi:hypothetical protein